MYHHRRVLRGLLGGSRTVLFLQATLFTTEVPGLAHSKDEHLGALLPGYFSQEGGGYSIIAFKHQFWYDREVKQRQFWSLTR